MESTPIGTVTHRLVLEITLSSLVADRTIEGMVGEEELHDTLSCLVNQW
jgi:hypothetical protein